MNNNFRKYPIFIAFLLILAVIFTGLFDHVRFWGINHLKYFPYFAAAIFAFVYISLYLLIQKSELPENIEYKINAMDSTSFRLIMFTLPVIMLIVFCLLRTEVHVLGDGYQRIYEIEQGYHYNHTEPLDFYLHAVIYGSLNYFTAASAEAVYSWFSIIGGVIFMIALIPAPLDQSRFDSLIAKALIMSFGGSQIFFGYVESYSLIYPASILFVIFAYHTNKSYKGYFLISFILSIAIASHLMGIILLPTWGYLMSRKARGKGLSGDPGYITGIGLILITLAVLGITDYSDWLVTREIRSPLGDILLPLTGQYAIFSLRHLLDLLNEFSLIIPTALIMLPMLFIKTPTNRNMRILILLLFIPAGLFLLMVDPKLGMARDWDLFAPAAAVIGTVIIMQLVYSGRWRSVDTKLKLIVVLTGFLQMAPWIILNSSELPQLDRAEEIVMSTDKEQGYGLELLAHHYSEIREENSKALRILQEISGESRNARVLYKIARLQFKNADFAGALNSSLEGLRLDSTDTKLQVIAGGARLALDQPSKALPYLLSAAAKMPEEFLIAQYLGESYFLLDSLDRSLEWFNKVLELSPDHPRALYYSATAYFKAKQPYKAYEITTRLLKIDPAYPGAEELNRAILLKINEEGN